MFKKHDFNLLKIKVLLGAPIKALKDSLVLMTALSRFILLGAVAVENRNDISRKNATLDHFSAVITNPLNARRRVFRCRC